MLRLLLLSLVLLPLVAQAQSQWKWRDAEGRIQYSDKQPPASVAEKDILGRPPGALRPRQVQVVPIGQAASAPASAAAPAPKASTAVERAAASDKARQASEVEAKKKADEQQAAQLRAENCKAARENVASLQSGVRIARTNEKGEREILDDAERARQLQRAQAAVASQCK
jgi:Domain of unknown function (DUF4124)